MRGIEVQAPASSARRAVMSGGQADGWPFYDPSVVVAGMEEPHLQRWLEIIVYGNFGASMA